MKRSPILALACLVGGLTSASAVSADGPSTNHKYNVLFIISDDLTSTALSCYTFPLSRRRLTTPRSRTAK
jgi:hypothetical protein